jgi:hypothetical protein
MSSFLKVGLTALLALASVGACDRQGARPAADEGFDADEYVEEEFRDFFEVEDKAGAAQRLPEQALLLPNIA